MRKVLTILVTTLFLSYSVVAQQKNDSMKTALLIVDIQKFYFPGDGPGLVNAEPAARAAKEVLQIQNSIKYFGLTCNTSTNHR